MRTLIEDLRHALRGLGNEPGFAVVAVVTLAIGIGVNTAIFSIVDAVLLRPLPYRNPEQLVRLYETESAPGKYPFAGPDYMDWKKQNSTFQDMTLFGWAGDTNVSGEGRPDHIRTLPTEANFFKLFGVEPIIGRTFATGEDQPGAPKVAVISYAIWKSRFAGDPAAVGRTIELNSTKFTVIGVMPAYFRFPPAAQIWIPFDMSPKGLGWRGNHSFNAIGRMKPGVGVKAAHADVALIALRLEQQYPNSNHAVGGGAVSLHEDVAGRSRDSLLMMLSAVGLVLLIACANVANLQLSRALARQKEMAVRSALGAGRARLVGQLLTESLVLSAAGGALGLLLGWGMIGLFSRAESIALPRYNPVQLDAKVLAFTCALAALTGILFGIYPALRTSRPDLFEELKGGAGSSLSPGRQRRFTSNILVVSEFALSLLLLASAGLLLKDFARVRGLDIGVRTEGVWTAAVQLPNANYPDGRKRLAFADALADRARQIPGVDVAALTNRLPLEGGSNYYITIRGQQSSPDKSSILVETHDASPDYFRSLGIRLLKGRFFTPADVQAEITAEEQRRKLFPDGARPTAADTNAMVSPTVINETMMRTFWPNRDPIGQMFSNGGDSGPWRQVIGVASDVRERGLTERPVPEAYDVFDGSPRLFLVLHASLKPAPLTAEVRRNLEQLDRSLPLFSIRTMDDVIADNAQGQRFLSLLIGSFAAIAALLAAIGIYGVLSYLVTQRTREIGIRIALGASRARVLGDVLREGARLAVAGFAIGTCGALAAGRILESLLHEVKPGDPAVLLATGGLLAAVALVACYLPARRAARLDPTNALRYE